MSDEAETRQEIQKRCAREHRCRDCARLNADGGCGADDCQFCGTAVNSVCNFRPKPPEAPHAASAFAERASRYIRGTFEVRTQLVESSLLAPKVLSDEIDEDPLDVVCYPFGAEVRQVLTEEQTSYLLQLSDAQRQLAEVRGWFERERDANAELTNEARRLGKELDCYKELLRDAQCKRDTYRNDRSVARNERSVARRARDTALRELAELRSALGALT